MTRAPRRPNVTLDEKAAMLAAIQIIQDDESALSTRGYMYRIWKRGDIYLHGELCTKGHNEETIQGLVLEFRQEGYISWDSVLDETRRTIGDYTYNESPDERIEGIGSLSAGYELSIWADQPHRVVLLSEKETLTPIVSRVTEEYQVPLWPCKGFNSWSAFWKLAKDIALEEKTTWILILTDHDKAGYDMSDSAEKIMNRLIVEAAAQFDMEVPVLKFDRIGLNAFQMRDYRIDPRPPKDSQRPGIKNYIEKCAEVDFLRAEEIEEIVRNGIENHLDTDILDRTRRQEERDIAKLRRFANRIAPVIAEMWEEESHEDDEDDQADE